MRRGCSRCWLQAFPKPAAAFSMGSKKGSDMTNSTKPELKPCPFECGSSDVELKDFTKTTPFSGRGKSWVKCQTCKSEGPKCGTPSEAITAWNTRAPLPKLKASCFTCAYNDRMTSVEPCRSCPAAGPDGRGWPKYKPRPTPPKTGGE